MRRGTGRRPLRRRRTKTERVAGTGKETDRSAARSRSMPDTADNPVPPGNRTTGRAFRKAACRNRSRVHRAMRTRTRRPARPYRYCLRQRLTILIPSADRAVRAECLTIQRFPTGGNLLLRRLPAFGHPFCHPFDRPPTSPGDNRRPPSGGRLDPPGPWRFGCSSPSVPCSRTGLSP